MAESTPWRSGRLVRGRGPRLLFGWSYEDERVELAAFGPPGRVLVIAAAGETAAACAAAGHEVIAVDVNPVQLRYARDRVGGGPVIRGTAERAMAIGRSALAAVDPHWRRDSVRSALATGTAAALLGRRSTAVLLATVLRPGAAAARVLRPEFAEFVPPGFDETLRRRVADGLVRHGGDHRVAWRLLAGIEEPGWSLPLVDPAAIDWVGADVLDLLDRTPAGSLDGISLSNVTDGAPPAFAARLQVAARRALRPGAALVRRSFAGPGDTTDASLLWGTVTAG